MARKSKTPVDIDRVVDCVDTKRIHDTDSALDELRRTLGTTRGNNLRDNMESDEINAYLNHPTIKLASKRTSDVFYSDSDIEAYELGSQRRRAESVKVKISKLKKTYLYTRDDKRIYGVKSKAWSDAETLFIKNRLSIESNYDILYDYYDTFGKVRSIESIRSKKKRLRK